MWLILVEEIFTSNKENDIIQTLIKEYKESPSNELLRKHSLELYLTWLSRQEATLEKSGSDAKNFWKAIFQKIDVAIKEINKLLKTKNCEELKILKSILNLINKGLKEDLLFEEVGDLIDSPDALKQRFQSKGYIMKVNHI